MAVGSRLGRMLRAVPELGDRRPACDDPMASPAISQAAGALHELASMAAASQSRLTGDTRLRTRRRARARARARARSRLRNRSSPPAQTGEAALRSGRQRASQAPHDRMAETEVSSLLAEPCELPGNVARQRLDAADGGVGVKAQLGGELLPLAST